MILKLYGVLVLADLTLRTICKELGRASHKWFKIGILLGIPRHVLKQYEKEDDPLSAVIDYWLEGNAEATAAPISWYSITEALDSVKEAALADKISKKYCQQEDYKVDILDFFQLAYSYNVAVEPRLNRSS